MEADKHHKISARDEALRVPWSRLRKISTESPNQLMNKNKIQCVERERGKRSRNKEPLPFHMTICLIRAEIANH